MRKTAVLPILTVLFVFISITLHGFVLKDVKFEGLKTIQKNELTYAYSAYIGKDINMYAIEDIVSQLEELGYFEDIQYVLEDVPGKENEKILLIKVVENEPVSQVSLEITGPELLPRKHSKAR